MTALITLDDTLTNPLKWRDITESIACLRRNGLVEVKANTLALRDGLSAQAAIDKITVDIEVAQSLEIDSDEMLAEAEAIAGRLAAVASDAGVLDAECQALAAPFYAVWKQIHAGYKAPRDFLNAIKAGVNRKIIAYAADKRQQAEAAARAERVERDRAAAIARAVEAKAELEAAKTLQDAAQAAPEQAAQMLQQAAASVDAARAQTQAALIEAATLPATALVTTRAKGTREMWEPAVDDEVRAILHIAAQMAAGDMTFRHLVRLDEGALKADVKLRRETFNLPGVRAVRREAISNRKGAL